jgi:hypothetical protein
VVIPIVLVAVLLILIGLLRSLLSPILLIGTVVLSFGAALGLSGLIFDLIYGLEHTDPGFPLYAFVFLVALGIDYNIFLMTRVREESINHGTRKGSLIALSSTGGVITAAGFVLAATFSALATMPFTFTLQLGTTIALGVLLDTMIVRSVLVTALNLDLGDKIWWPSTAQGGGALRDQLDEYVFLTAKPNSFIVYEGIDLTGIRRVLFRPNWHLYDIYPGGKVEVRIGAPDGERIGETYLEREQFNTRYRGAFGGLANMTEEQAERSRRYPRIDERKFFAPGSDKNAFTIPSIATLTAKEGKHDIYFVLSKHAILYWNYDFDIF